MKKHFLSSLIVMMVVGALTFTTTALAFDTILSRTSGSSAVCGPGTYYNQYSGLTGTLTEVVVAVPDGYGADIDNIYTITVHYNGASATQMTDPTSRAADFSNFNISARTITQIDVSNSNGVPSANADAYISGSNACENVVGLALLGNTGDIGSSGVSQNMVNTLVDNVKGAINDNIVSLSVMGALVVVVGLMWKYGKKFLR